MRLTAKTHTLLQQDGVSHGFFSRNGGVSSAQYRSLNAGYGSDDMAQNVRENRSRIAAHLGTTEPRLISLSQIHSCKVITIDAPLGEAVLADGLVTKTPNLAISALSADCGPVLFVDPHAHIIGACHAGWRGALSGITDSTIDAMEALGSERENICAVLGPCISQDSYEVGPEFRDNFAAEDERFDRFFKLDLKKPDAERRPHFDLKRFILFRLRQAGLSRIDSLPDCTYAQPERYFSYRYNTHNGISDYGRNISAIMLRE